MSDTITVAEYCKRHNTSTQAVYARIKRGTLNSTIVNGMKMIVDDSVADIQSHDTTILNEYTRLLQSTIKEQKKEIKRLHKTIKLLEKERFKSVDALIGVLTDKSTPRHIEDHSVIDVKPGKVKKSGKKKKNKK